MASRAAAGTSLIDTIVSRSITDGITVYDIEFKGGQGEIAVAEDGSVIDRETIVSIRDVPAAALDHPQITQTIICVICG